MRRSLVVLLASFLVLAGVPTTASADTAPTEPGTPVTVSADILPTPQINGVVWTQLVAGDRVYVGGDFTSARPFGAPEGVGETPRTHLLAYDINTGELIQDFAPVVNGQVLALALSPNGRTLYVGGSFDRIDGKPRSRLAAIDVATGAVKSNWRTVASTTVRSITATATTVYFGGDFASAANGPGQETVPRPFLASSDAVTGELTDWIPAPDRYVRALELTQDNSKLVVGGHFETISGQTWYGLAALDPVTAEPLPWLASSTGEIRNYGPGASVTSLTSDDRGMLVTAYTFSGGGNLESVARLSESDGAVTWITDCRGDTYSAFAQGDAVYTASHIHRCANVPDGWDERFPRYSPGSSTFTNYPDGELKPDMYGWVDRAGSPAPRMLHFNPLFYFGTYTSSDQGAWNVTGTDKYLLFGGEFIGLNGTLQQGLTRMARPDAAANLKGPVTVPEMTPTVVSYAEGQAHIGWQETYDHDNRQLTYDLYRDYTSTANKPIYTVASDSAWHDQGSLSFIDTGLVPGAVHDYLVVATDAFGNRRASGRASVTIAGAESGNPYGQAVLADRPEHYYRFTGQSQTLTDLGGSVPSTSASGVSLASSSPVGDAADTSGSFDGGAEAYSLSLPQGPFTDVFTLEAWVRSSDATGGRILGFSNGFRTTTDRHIYLDTLGRIRFGVDDRGWTKVSIATESAGYNDDQWHHVVATLSQDGMHLFVDGELQASNASVTQGRPMAGSWRIGGDALSGWDSAEPNGQFEGQIDEVAIYHRALTPDQVKAHFEASKAVVEANQPPRAEFTLTADGRTVSFDASASADSDGTIASYQWDFGDGTTGSGRTIQHTYAKDGAFRVSLTVTDDDGAAGGRTDLVTIDTTITLATDDFTRSTELGGWGSTFPGGTWTPCNHCRAEGGAGRMTLPAATNSFSMLPEVSQTSTDVVVEASLQDAPTGSGTYIAVVPRGNGIEGYRARLTLTPSGEAYATLQRIVGRTTVDLAAGPVSGLDFSPGTAIVLRAQAESISPTQTILRFKVWNADQAEPANWTVEATDSDPAWQKAGSPGLWAFSPLDAARPTTVAWDNLLVKTLPQ